MRPLSSQTAPRQPFPGSLGEGLCPPCLMLRGTAGAVGRPRGAAWPESAPLALITLSPGAHAGIPCSTAVTRTQQTLGNSFACTVVGSWCCFGIPVSVQGGVLDGTTHRRIGLWRCWGCSERKMCLSKCNHSRCSVFFYFSVLILPLRSSSVHIT